MTNIESFVLEKAKFSPHLCHPRYWLLWLGVGLSRLSVMLPLRLQMKLGSALGILSKKFLKSRVHIAKRNIALCFPDMSSKDQQKLLDQNFKECGKAIFDTMNAWWWSNKKINNHMSISGTEYVQETIDNGQGVILFAVHCLPLEMGARIFGQFEPGIGVYRPHNNPVMEYLQVKGRLRSNKALISKRDIRQMVRSLRNKNVVWYTADQDFGRSSAVFIPFFAVPDAASITGTTSLAKLGRAKVFPFFVERTANDAGYKIDIMPPLEDFPGTDELQDAIRGNEIIETLIERNPSQYMWLHRRFKTRPEGQQSVY